MVHLNFGKARQVWSQMGKLIRREEAETQVSAMFYWEVLQAVLLIGEETPVLLEVISPIWRECMWDS